MVLSFFSEQRYNLMNLGKWQIRVLLLIRCIRNTDNQLILSEYAGLFKVSSVLASNLWDSYKHDCRMQVVVLI